MGCLFTIHIGNPPIRNGILDYDKAWKQPNIVVGECSFLKQVLFDEDKFVPEPISKLSDIIPHWRQGRAIINEELIKKVESIEWKNTSFYVLLISKRDLVMFLKKYMGGPCYHECW